MFCFEVPKQKALGYSHPSTLSVCYGIQTSSFLLLVFKPCLFQFNVFFLCVMFFSKHKERTVELLFSLVILEKRVGELCNVPIPQMFLLAFVGLVNPSGGCATEIFCSLSQCGK